MLLLEFCRLNHILAGSMQFLLDFSPRRTAGDPSPTILRRRHQHNNKKQITIAIPRDRHSRESAASSLDHLRTKETCNRRHTKHKVTQHPHPITKPSEFGERPCHEPGLGMTSSDPITRVPEIRRLRVLVVPKANLTDIFAMCSIPKVQHGMVYPSD